MTKDEQKELIVNAVVKAQGCKGAELPCLLGPKIAGITDFPTLLEEMVSEGRLTEIEYFLESSSYRLRSFYLPGNATVRVVGD